MAGVNGIKSNNPYLAKLLNIFTKASDPSEPAGQSNDLSSFLQELESQHNPSSQVNQAKSNPVGGRPGREAMPLKTLRPNMDTVEISDEAYEAFRRMQEGTSDDIDLP